MKILNLGRSVGVLSATAIAATVTVSSIGAASAQIARNLNETTRGALHQTQMKNEESASLQTVLRLEAHESPYVDVTRIQVPANDGGLKWVIEKERADK